MSSLYRFLAAYHERGERKTEREISGNCGGMDVDDDRWGGVARGVRGSNSCDGGRGLSSEGVGQM